MATVQNPIDARVTDHIEVDDITAQGLLDALVDPVRRSIVRQLFVSDSDIACGRFNINVSRSTGTHHFKVLRQAGVIRQYYVGTSKMNTLRRTDLESVAPGLIGAIMAMPETTSRPTGVGPAGASFTG